jgi:hypothetical protein
VAVDVQALTSSYEQEVRRLRTETLQQIHDVVATALEAHPDQREDVLNELREQRARFRDAGRTDMEDILLDVMDMMAGWSARAVRL